jgi:tRNA A37 N6-isopentenylltransferase MiaA
MESKSSTKDKIVFIIGTTATGKTRLSCTIANTFKGEIINGDSM